MSIENKPNLFGLSLDELEELARSLGKPAYRGRQIFRSVYGSLAQDFEQMTALDRSFRQELASRFQIEWPAIRERCVSNDQSVRYVLEINDGQAVEAVYMPQSRRTTLCLSSQAGCAVDCRFCFTALMGLKRNLTAGEILGQAYRIIEDQNISSDTRLNFVFMGMGEPLLNYEPVMKAVRIFADPGGLAISPRRMTISTSGVIPRIQALGREKVRPKLAISLNASTGDQRTALMPINHKYPLEELISACRSYPLRPRERLTFEYIMLDGVNDALEDATWVAALLKDLRAKVNLIPYNSGNELSFQASPMERIIRFEECLRNAGVPAFIRLSRGRDVNAACGQLLINHSRTPMTAIIRPAELPSFR